MSRVSSVDIAAEWGVIPPLATREVALHNLMCHAFQKKNGTKRYDEFVELSGPEGVWCIYSMRQGHDCELLVPPEGYQILRRMKA